ncbi:MAG: undecaprenyl-diphosphatase UppP [Clostridiales bacterium]|jgi:undecaprenyl-diphosphatase|nr:undecaprenyl-diphosphatase UppP [Clostridiales bacterium]MDR2712214.1 undecaprenyl-diphosphatase UppP [Clostridiales bacterium]
MISFWQALFLGILQGLTEFLPVSSSGHLVIFQSFFGIEEPVLLFDTCLHIGSLAAVFIFFWRDIWAILRRPVCKEMGLLIAGTIPVVIAGFLFQDNLEKLFSSVLAVCLALVITGTLLFISDRLEGRKQMKELSYPAALLVGCFQALALTPGLSRSGSTIFGSLLAGLDRKSAAKYSFLLSIPAILGATVLQFRDILKEGHSLILPFSYLVGTLAAAVVGFFAIKFLLKLLEKKNLKGFAYYCWTFAAISLIWLIFN